ncbi:MAG: M14 family zinc carboxypeptidase, partial [bacterium]
TLDDLTSLTAQLTTSPHVVKSVIGSSEQGRDMVMFEVTDFSVANTNKQRVWIHTAVHPSENTAHFVTDGLLLWLVSEEPEAETLLDHVIFDVVPMANPDGDYLGNYRVTSTNINLEIQWGFPYDSTVPEIVAMRSKIEEFMGTSGNPGSHPIKLLLNLHSSHNVNYPFNFVHTPTYFQDGTGVTPSVNALEVDWVAKLEARSAFVALGSNQSSTLGSRPYVESMMHDRYSIDPTWDDIMAITLEGTYQRSPRPGEANTPNDYRQVGKEIGLAIADFFGIPLAASLSGWMLN